MTGPGAPLAIRYHGTVKSLKKQPEIVLDRPIYSPKEVARLAGVHPSTILNYIRSGRLYALRLSERTYRIPVKAVAKMLAPERVRAPRIVERPFAKFDLAAFERRLGREHRRRQTRG